MKVYIFVIQRNTWNNDKKNVQQKEGWAILGNHDLIYRRFNNIVICFIPEGFNDNPDTICNKLNGSLHINLSLQDFKIIYSSPNHKPGESWLSSNINIARKETTSENIGVYRSYILQGNLKFLQSLDPLIIVFTLEYSEVDYPEWHKAINSNKANFYDDNLNSFTPKNNNDKKKIIIAEFKVDDYTVLFVKENELEADKGGINDLLSKILDKWGKNLNKKDIYVAVHALSTYAKNGDINKFKDEFKNKVNYICNFHHTDDYLYKEFCGGSAGDKNCTLIKFIEALENEKNDDAKNLCNQMIELIKKMAVQPIKTFSLLKHRIAHLFLPLDIDLQGISEVEENKRIEYLKAVLEEKNNDSCYYRRKLAKLQYIIAGEKVDFQNAKGTLQSEDGKITKCEPVGLNDEEKKNLLADGMSILDLIEKSEKKEKILNSREWNNLLELAGLNDSYKPKDSPILSFLCLMDSKIKKGDISLDDVNEILNPFSNWKIEGANPEVINSFHDWFCALNDCLDKIREKLLKEEGK